MRFRRFFALPDAPFDGLNFNLSTEVYVDPSLFARPQTWEIKSYSLSIVASSQFKFSIVRRGRYPTPLRRIWQTISQALEPSFIHGYLNLISDRRGDIESVSISGSRSYSNQENADTLPIADLATRRNVMAVLGAIRCKGRPACGAAVRVGSVWQCSLSITRSEII